VFGGVADGSVPLSAADCDRDCVTVTMSDCGCVQVTEGPDAGKLALLDFGLVAEIPPQDRAAMVSATIHLVGQRERERTQLLTSPGAHAQHMLCALLLHYLKQACSYQTGTFTFHCMEHANVGEAIYMV
jgi:predicted unusual protein kinase regulating ubiquinone biosynthesis (AarF/ABC1/UbiB family)